METIEFWFTPASILLAFFGLVWGIYIYKKQSNIQIFLEYTKRYSEIMDGFPKDARIYRVNSSELLPEESTDLTLSVLKYLNLSSEEFYLMRNHQLSKRIWRIWEDELIRTIKSNLIRREWTKIKHEFESYKEFQNYVETNLSKN